MDRAEDIARRVAQGHATGKHLHEFEGCGEPTKTQYKNHVANVLRDPNIQCFTAYTTIQPWRQADIYYHHPTNTLIVDPADRSQEATAFRPRNKEKAFVGKHEETECIEGREVLMLKGINTLAQQKTDQPKKSNGLKRIAEQAALRGGDRAHGKPTTARNKSGPDKGRSR